MSIQLRQNAQTLIRDAVGARAGRDGGSGTPRRSRGEDAWRKQAFFGFRFGAYAEVMRDDRSSAADYEVGATG